MSQGVHKGIERIESTKNATATRTAVRNSEAVKTQSRKFTACGFVRAIPPTCRDICKSWCLTVAPAHYVESTRWKEQDRFVAHLSKAADGDAEGTDVNSRSK